MLCPPSYLNSRLLGYVTIGYIESSSHYLGNWSPRVRCEKESLTLSGFASSEKKVPKENIQMHPCCEDAV